MQPGKKPASKKPMRTRQTTRPAKELVQPMPIVMIPHTPMTELKNTEGRIFFSRILLGTSNKMYVMKNVNNALSKISEYQETTRRRTYIL